MKMKSVSSAMVLLLASTFFSGCAHMIGSQDPLTADEHMKLGSSYEDKGLRSAAAKEYGAALRKQKNYVPAYIALGNLSFEEGNLVEAEIYYRKALDKEPDHPSANNNLAVVYLTRGSRLDTAEQLAQRALKSAGALSPYVLDTLAHIYMREGRYQQAKAALDAADAQAPTDNVFLKQRLFQTRRNLETYTANGSKG